MSAIGPAIDYSVFVHSTFAQFAVVHGFDTTRVGQSYADPSTQHAFAWFVMGAGAISNYRPGDGARMTTETQE